MKTMSKNTTLDSLSAFFKRRPKMLFFPALAFGLFVLVLSIALKPKLAVTATDSAVRGVDILALKPIQIAPQVTGYGQVKPKHQWRAIAEVTGEIIYESPQLLKGNFIAAGTELLRIDPLMYQLALAQAQANLKSHQLQLEKLKQEQVNLSQNYTIENNRLLLSTKENKRLTQLNKQGLYSQSKLDEQRLQLLTLERTVQEIEQQLALFDNEKSVAIAQINLSTASVEEAERALSKTVIVAPRNLKLAQVDVEQNQVVSINQTMLSGHALEVMEVEAQVSLHDMHTLISGIRKKPENIEITPDILNKISATIKLNSAQIDQSWRANVTRISETIDPTQATVGVILEVEQDLTNLAAGRPPLLNGMFIQAILTGQPAMQFAVPEKALHTNRLYIMDSNDQLNIVPVTVLYRTTTHTIVSGNLSVNDRLILNDLLPAVQGMKLKVHTDTVTDITASRGTH